MGIYLTEVPSTSCGFRNQVLVSICQGFVGRRLDGDGLFEQPIKQFAAAERLAAVEAEGELFQGKSPDFLLIAHKLDSDHDAKFDICQP